MWRTCGRRSKRTRGAGTTRSSFPAESSQRASLTTVGCFTNFLSRRLWPESGASIWLPRTACLRSRWRGAVERYGALTLMTRLSRTGRRATGVDRTMGQGRARRAFDIARSALGLQVERVNMNIYDVGPAELGQFDFVFMGNILLHLSDPGRALKAARSVTAGSFLSFEIISLNLSLLKPRTPCAALAAQPQQWWTANLAAYKQLLVGAGFEIVDSRFPLFQRFGPHLQDQPFRPDPPWRWPRLYGEHLAFWFFWRPFGVPSAWALCR